MSNKNDIKLVETPLSIAYRDENEITIKNGLDLSLKDKVWGVRLPNNVIISVKFIDDMNWRMISDLVTKNLVCNGKFGRLPLSEDFNWENNKDEIDLFRNTQQILEQYGVDVDISSERREDGIIWLDDDSDYDFEAYLLCLDDYDTDSFGTRAKFSFTRIGVVFEEN